MSLDLTGEGKDDIPGAYFSRLRPDVLKYLKGIPVRIADKKGIHINLKNTIQQIKIPLLDVVKIFYKSGWKNDKFTPDVGSSVPNLLDVLKQTVKKPTTSSVTPPVTPPVKPGTPPVKPAGT
jgi:hypothetical protein